MCVSPTALNGTVTEILDQLTKLRDHADSVLGSISGIINKTYETEMQRVDEEVQLVESAHSLAMSAQYNVTSHKNMSENLNKTMLQAQGSYLISNGMFDLMKPQIVTITDRTNEAVALMNQTKVCSTASSFFVCAIDLFFKVSAEH